jgi:hypothetical protein
MEGMHYMFFSAITALIMMSGIFLKGIDQPRDFLYTLSYYLQFCYFNFFELLFMFILRS